MVEVNSNRSYWEKYFTEIIYNFDVNGKCFLTLEEWKSYKNGELKYEDINPDF
jgi:hypothetical protein